MKPNHSNSDNLKEQIGDILYKYNDIDGHYDFEPATDELLQLYKDYAMGCVPPEQSEDFDEIGKEIHNGYIPDSNDIATIEELRINQGYNQARQDILDNLKGIDNT